MGKITGFMEIDRHDRQATSRRPTGCVSYREFMIPLEERDVERQAARCMDCGIPYCHNGCPVNNQIPDWNDLVYAKDWQEASRNLHSHQQLSGVHRPHLPGPMRSRLYTQHRRQPGDHQDHRMRNRRQGVGRRLDRPGNPGTADRQVDRNYWCGTGGNGRGSTTRPRRPRCACLRKERQTWRSDALRHSGLQDGKASDRPARSTDGGRGRHVPLWRSCR